MNSVVFFLILAGAISGNALTSERTLFDFSQPNAEKWRSVNDGVMGGRSVGSSKINGEKNLEFSGRLSLENNGGFSSIRTRGNNLNMAEGDSVILRVRGDGRSYNMNLYSQSNLGGYSFRQSFQTRKGEWIEVKLPVEQFRATWRGRSYSRVRLDPAQVKGMGILLGDKKPGPFRLEVAWIKIARSDAGE